MHCESNLGKLVKRVVGSKTAAYFGVHPFREDLQKTRVRLKGQSLAIHSQVRGQKSSNLFHSIGTPEITEIYSNMYLFSLFLKVTKKEMLGC